jgi:hypothetical protein
MIALMEKNIESSRELELLVDNTNVVYIDEYPELKKRVWLRRLAAERSGQLASTDLIIFPTPPDGAA